MLARFQKRRRFTIAHAVLQDTSVDRPLYQDYGGKRNSFGNHDRKFGILKNAKPTPVRLFEMKSDSLASTLNGHSIKSMSASSSFLTEEENNEILELLGDDCTCVEKAIARVYSASSMKWDYIGEGVICFVRDKIARSVTLRLIAGFSTMFPKPYEKWNFLMEASTKLVTRRNNFATVQLDSGDIYGIIFHDDKEGRNFVENVNERQSRRQLHREKTTMRKRESNIENGNDPPVSTTSNGVLANIGNKFSSTVKKAQKKLAGSGTKNKKKNKITSQEIGRPTNFVHLEHKGPDGDFQVLAPAPENLSNLMLAPQIPSRRESAFIKELHTPTNHTQTSNNSNHRRPPPPVHTNTIHSITESTPTLNGTHKQGQSFTDARCSIRIKKEEEPKRLTPHSLKSNQLRRRISEIDSPTSSTPDTENGHKPPALPKPPRTYQHIDPSPAKQPNLSRTETTRRPLPPPPSDDGLASNKAKPIQPPVSKTGFVKTSPPAPPPPPAPLLTPSTAPPAPPPPPPPPPPPSLLASSSPSSGIPAEINSSTRGDLMAAIRQAGGTSILKEKSTTKTPKSEYQPKIDAEKVGDRRSEGNGLMAALADKMNHMRKDINPSDSEDSSNEDESDEDDWSE